jgi:hypothetical protein
VPQARTLLKQLMEKLLSGALASAGSIRLTSRASDRSCCVAKISVDRNEERLVRNVPYDSRKQWRIVANSIIDYLSALCIYVMCPDPCLHEGEQLFRDRCGLRMKWYVHA